MREACPDDEEVRREIESLLRRRDAPDVVLPPIPLADDPAPGGRLGPYQILDLIGAGGMGRVYRARDTRLNRLVAIKILRAEVAGQPGFPRRFEREARAVSNLNHPHICTLHDIGSRTAQTFWSWNTWKAQPWQTFCPRVRCRWM